MNGDRLIVLSPGELLRMKLEAARVHRDVPRLTKREARNFVARSEGFADWGAVVRAVSTEMQERRA